MRVILCMCHAGQRLVQVTISVSMVTDDGQSTSVCVYIEGPVPDGATMLFYCTTLTSGNTIVIEKSAEFIQLCEVDVFIVGEYSY